MDRRMPATRTALARRCAATDRQITVANSRVLQVYDLLKIGEELVFVRSIDDPIVTIDRGIAGTVASRHGPRKSIHIIGVAMPENAVTPPMYRPRKVSA